jgi:hypothetical protein
MVCRRMRPEARKGLVVVLRVVEDMQWDRHLYCTLSEAVLD